MEVSLEDRLPSSIEEGKAGPRAQQGWLQASSERFDSELPAFKPPRQQPLAAACPSLSKRASQLSSSKVPPCSFAAHVKIPSLEGWREATAVAKRLGGLVSVPEDRKSTRLNSSH